MPVNWKEPSRLTKVPRKTTLPVATNSLPSRHGRSVMTCGAKWSSPDKPPPPGWAAPAGEPAMRQTTSATVTDTALSVVRMTTSSAWVCRTRPGASAARLGRSGGRNIGDSLNPRGDLTAAGHSSGRPVPEHEGALPGRSTLGAAHSEPRYPPDRKGVVEGG